jgi:hypothetical protein
MRWGGGYLYSVGTKSQGLDFAANGSLTLYMQHEYPSEERLANWLPGFVTSAFSCGECSGQQASCGGGCPSPSAE